MSTYKRQISLGFTPELYPEGTHICYLFNDDNERKRFMPAYVHSGIEEQETVDYVADVPTHDLLDHVAEDLGLNMPYAQWQNRLALATALETYCPDGHFSPDEMLDRLRDMYMVRRGAGCPGVRASGEMTWALRGIPGSERLVEYEARINDLVRDVPLTVMCQYDTRRFDGGTIFEILNVHPIMVVRGQILRNPFYVPPDQYFAEKRAAHRSG
jgi:hypothetical protein